MTEWQHTCGTADRAVTETAVVEAQSSENPYQLLGLMVVANFGKLSVEHLTA